MSQSTSVLIESDPKTTVFDPIFKLFDIPSPSRYPHDMLTSPSTATVALGRGWTPHNNPPKLISPVLLQRSPTPAVLYIPARIQHETDLVCPGSQFNTSPSPAPPSPVVQIRIPPPAGVPPPPPHIYHHINTTIEHDIAAIIQSHTFNDKKSYTCVWSNCPFVTHSKATAFTHARKHLGDPKLYACSCGTGFTCQASAKRHCDARNKIFECAFCLKKFARRDYRLVHQRRCNATHPM